MNMQCTCARNVSAILCLMGAILVPIGAFAQAPPYHLKPGDVLDISVWKEEDMERKVLVLPDGTISYPLAGHLSAAGKTPKEVQRDLKARLSKFFKDALVNVSVQATLGNKIYVIGQVASPGAFN